MSFAASAVAASAVIGGAAARSDRKAGERSADRSRESIEQGVARAEQAVERLSPRAEEFRLGGFQNAQNIFGSAVPQQLQAFQQGNRQAQQTVGDFTQQSINALRGSPVDQGFLQPKEQFQPDFGFLNTEFTVPERVVDPETAQAVSLSNQVDGEIANAFRDILGREPDPTGLAIYRRLITNDRGEPTGEGIEKMIAALRDSREFRALSQNQNTQNTQGNQGFDLLGNVDLSGIQNAFGGL